MDCPKCARPMREDGFNCRNERLYVCQNRDCGIYKKGNTQNDLNAMRKPEPKKAAKEAA